MNKKAILIFIALSIITALLVSCGSETVKAEPEAEEKISLAQWFTKESFGEGDAALPYWLYTPEKAEEGMPLIVVLHCSYMKSEDTLDVEANLDVMTDPEKKDITSYIYNGEFGKIPAYIIMPQTSAASRGWAKRGEDILALTEDCIQRFAIDRERVSLIGYSMGGTGALELASAYPELFDRVVAVAGGLDGVTNNNIPYVRGEGRMKLGEEYYPELRIPTKKDSAVFEAEKMKFVYAAKDSTALAASDEEKTAAAEFEAERVAQVAESVKNGTASLWMLIGANDAEVSPTVTRGIYDILGDRARCDIIADCGHSGILNTAIEKNEEIIDFLTK